MTLRDLADLPFAQSERLPADPLAVSPGRFTATSEDPQHPNDRRKRPDPFAHIIVPDEPETSK